jgi:hypothetical protein
MAISFACACGKSYTRRDEYAGSPMVCKGCGAKIRVPTRGDVAAGEVPGAPTVWVAAGDGAFTPPRPSRPGEPWYYAFLLATAYLNVALSAVLLALGAGVLARGAGAGDPDAVAALGPGAGWALAYFLSSSWLLAATRLGVEVGRGLRRLGAKGP